MRAVVTITLLVFLAVWPFAARSAEMDMDHEMGHEMKTAPSESPIPKMSKEQLITLARSAAPASISKDATIMISGEDGKMVEAVKGTNGFTCFPDIDGMKDPDPICGDAASMQWADDFMKGAPKPTNTVPGVAYMAKGGWHWEKDGKILLKREDGSKTVKEPPHWMVFWPVDKTSGLPTFPDAFGTYIMWKDTPYAHLMIHQDPNKIR